jgi:transposase
LAAAGEEPEVVLEATYGWYWVADLLASEGAKVYLAHPLDNWGHKRVNNDERDATDPVDLLRLAQSWVAPPPLRKLRELVRYRHRLVEMRTSLEGARLGTPAFARRPLPLQVGLDRATVPAEVTGDRGVRPPSFPECMCFHVFSCVSMALGSFHCMW